MRHSVFSSVIGLGLAITALTPTMANAATANGTAKVTTLRPLTLVRTSDLEFGSLAPSATAGTATIDATTGARSLSGGVVGAAGATPGPARFTASGIVGLIALVTLPTSITLTRGGGTETMTVTNITTNGGTTRLFPATPTIDIAVGGRLNVGAGQRDGSYAGTFTVTVLYL